MTLVSNFLAGNDDPNDSPDVHGHHQEHKQRALLLHAQTGQGAEKHPETLTL